MSDKQTDWFCSPDDGNTRAEVSILPGEMVVCLWRCEGCLEDIQEALRESGLRVEIEWQGPCRHEVRFEQVNCGD